MEYKMYIQFIHIMDPNETDSISNHSLFSCSFMRTIQPEKKKKWRLGNRNVCLWFIGLNFRNIHLEKWRSWCFPHRWDSFLLHLLRHLTAKKKKRNVITQQLDAGWWTSCLRAAWHQLKLYYRSFQCSTILNVGTWYLCNTRSFLISGTKAVGYFDEQMNC